MTASVPLDSLQAILHLVVRQRDVGQPGKMTVNAERSALSRVIDGGNCPHRLPRCVHRQRAPLTVASADDLAVGSLFHDAIRHDSTSNVRTCSPSVPEQQLEGGIGGLEGPTCDSSS